MLKKSLTFVAVFAFFVLIVWEADTNATIKVLWRSLDVTMPLFMFLWCLVLGIIVFILINLFLHKVVEKQLCEASFIAKNKNLADDEETIVLKRKDVDCAMMLMVESMASITEGDLQKAKSNLADLQKIIGNDIMIDILRLKIYKGEKNFDKMEELSAKLENNPNLKLVGLKADIEAKMQKKQFKEALKTANKAFELRQDLYWVIESAFKLRVKSADWEGSMQVLNAGYQKRIINKEKFEKFKSVVLYELACKMKEEGDAINFFKFASQALECDPDFVPAALLLAQYYMENDRQVRKAAKILSKIWRTNPTTEVAETYLNLWPEDSMLERVQRMESLALTNGKNPSINNLILADLYCKANLWGKVKNEFEIFLINNPATKKLAKTIAYYEKHANNNEQSTEKWKKKSNECVSDSVWVCSCCGHASSKWHPYCKKCDEVGSFEWKLFADKK